ncbi:MAG TPA: SGNH/GDSL hydrolase family protein [Sandaracinaceae bacterium LLY-WYZ-13_1]|nr:SGNH/GDSL hydrolase family protein [Sandaracinaceae bacterium LLY-WYZ-13_1]
MAEQAREGWRRALGKGGLALGSTLVALLVAEGALRVLDVAPDRYGHPWHLETEDKRLGLDVYPDDPRDYFPLDLSDEATRARWRERGLPEVEERWRLTPHAVPFTYDDELCRGEPPGPPPPDRPRVVAIGDSFTEGQGVRQEDTYAAVLDRRLDAQVLNCGRRGYDFPRIAEWLDEKLVLAPDVVVYGMILNDPQQSEAFHERQAFLDDWILDRRRMVMHEPGGPPAWPPRLWMLVDDRLERMRVGAETTRWYRDMVGEPNRAGWEATLDQIASMHETMRARGGHLVVVLWPLLVDLDGDYPFAGVHATIAEALGARGVPFHDALPAFRGRDATELWVHPTDRHPNEVAHRLFADEVEAALTDVLPTGGSRS